MCVLTHTHTHSCTHARMHTRINHTHTHTIFFNSQQINIYIYICTILDIVASSLESHLLHPMAWRESDTLSSNSLIRSLLEHLISFTRGPDSSVDLATDYWHGHFGIESRWGRDFAPVQTDHGAHPVFCKMGNGSIPGLEAAGAGG